MNDLRIRYFLLQRRRRLLAFIQEFAWNADPVGSLFTEAQRAMYSARVIPTPAPTTSTGGSTGGAVGGGGTVLDVIRGNPDLSMFATALTLSGLDSALGDGSRQFTVLAPSNSAIENDPLFTTYVTVDGWLHHLRTNIQLMIVPDQGLLDSEVFDGFTTELESLNGTLAISQPFAQVNLVSPEGKGKEGSNGYVHIMEGVIKNYWREYTLREVDQHPELQEGLSPILKRIGFDDPLNEFVPTGTSWIACRNRGYGNDSIALGFYPIVQELTNVSNTDFQTYAYMYNLIDVNVYEQDIPRGYQSMVLPRNEDAHLWITKDMEKGILRFNDVELDRQALADNGYANSVSLMFSAFSFVSLHCSTMLLKCHTNSEEAFGPPRTCYGYGFHGSVHNHQPEGHGSVL